MKVLIDTCVLYPTVMREVLLGVAREGMFQPVWSPRILEEWARAARKLGPDGDVQARAEIAVVEMQFPQACVSVPDTIAARLWLPDDNDIHVLAAAIVSSSDAIMTVNAKDFPRQILADEGLIRVDPDSFLYELWLRDPEPVENVANRVLSEACRISGKNWDKRSLFKKARLPRCAKALS